MAAVLVHIDLDGERPHPSSLAALAAGRLVASSWGATLYAALIARDGEERRAPDSTAQVVTTAKIPGVEQIQGVLAQAGADKMVVALSDAPVTPLWATVGAAWQGVLDHLRPRLVLFGADGPSASELAPRTGAKIGARLLTRARPVGIEDVELRDRDGGYVRSTDGGAAVALVGHSREASALGATPRECEDIDVIVLAMPGGGDDRIELGDVVTAAPPQARGALVVIGDDAGVDDDLLTDARRLADTLNAPLVATAAAAKSAGKGTIDAVIERHAALAPEMCVQLGAAHIDVAGSASLVRIAAGGKNVDGAVPGVARELVAELAAKLESYE